MAASGPHRRAHLAIFPAVTAALSSFICGAHRNAHRETANLCDQVERSIRGPDSGKRSPGGHENIGLPFSGIISPTVIRAGRHMDADILVTLSASTIPR